MFSANPTEITVETARLVIVRRCRSLRGPCAQCGCEVDMIGLEQAGAIAGIEEPTLGANDVTLAWHVCQGPDGEFLVCLDSLLKSL